jgi:hypothetical protein
MLGRYQAPGCCPATRAGAPPGDDCGSGGPLGTRAAKRREARDVAAEVTAALSRPVADPFTDPLDCRHGCNGSPCGAERCTFTCHEAGQ